ncbi:unnamed protein product, partial [Phaeothamnion confervicola]
GGLPEGARALASGRLVVEGNVERSHVEGGRGVAIRGSCVGSRIRAGILCGIYARLLAVLRDADADMASVSAMADQLVASAPGGGRLVPADEAVEAVLATRFPRLDPVLAAASRLTRGRESGVPEGIVAAI